MVEQRKVVDFVGSIIVYLVLFYSIFDIYYTSPLVRGVHPIPLNTTPLATHLIFIVSDGLRADKLFGGTMENNPFLKSIILNNGSWGLSHTRVPTESRPCHIAMFGGFYEDVASVTKGWQANPVEFDSIFNRSSRAWAWGTHEVVSSFGLNAAKHITTVHSPRELADLAKHDIIEIDKWTVDQFLASLHDKQNGFFATSPSAAVATGELHKGNFAFLHMDAADMIGHAMKPGSSQYTEMLKNLDLLISRLVQEVDRATQGTNFRVAYIFTSDHGMTEWGSHGSGSLHETVTPLIAWGAGIVKPRPLPPDANENVASEVDTYGIPVGNHGRHRWEIRQADLCPLLASLLGTPIPVNSMGRVPLDILAVNDSQKVLLARANCLQILAQLEIKREEKRQSHFTTFFKEFSGTTASDIQSYLKSTEYLVASEQYEKAINRYEDLTSRALVAMNYYHKYDRAFFGLCVAITYCLWSVVILCTLAGPVDTSVYPSEHGICSSMFTLALMAVTFILISVVLGFAYLWPVMHTVYQLIPLILLLHLVLSRHRRMQIKKLWMIFNPCGSRYEYCSTLDKAPTERVRSTRAVLLTIACFCLLELLIWGFSYRPLLSVACIIFGLWPQLDRSFGARKVWASRLWFLACVSLAIFPLLPVIGSTFSPTLVFFSALFVAALNLLPIHWLVSISRGYLPYPSLDSPLSYRTLCYILSLLFALSGCAVSLVHSRLGLWFIFRLPVHVFAWSVIFITPAAVVYCMPPRLGLRVFGWTAVFLIPFILLSTHYEILFYAVFVSVGLLWVQIEIPVLTPNKLWNLHTLSDQSGETELLNPLSKQKSPPELLTLRNFRQSIFFMFLLVISFFGTGNIASLNSFDPRSTYCFITMLKPALMALFLIIKILCPMLFLGVIYGAVQFASNQRERRDLQADPDSGSQAVSAQIGLTAILSNFVAVHFFAWLRDEGSWLDIGNSISHYVIAMAIGMVAFLLSLLGKKMLTFKPPFTNISVSDKLS
ncbi:unnamed protein product [Calicophoron daubneyi]|uniref:GPI ethanolamine phosphate transferase 1 n=1 Tax=Calicophoron daubneyi TaxID=300641 RepID=A0AAV2TRA2_CALDB